MKKFACIFILLLSFGLKSTHAEYVQIFTAKYTSELSNSELSNSEKKSIQNSSAFSFSIIDSKESDENPFSKKRKRVKKGLSPIFFCLTSQFHFDIIAFEIELVYLPQAFYFSQRHYACGERGPPSTSLS